MGGMLREMNREGVDGGGSYNTVATMTNLVCLLLSEGYAAPRWATQAKRRLRVEVQMEWPRFGASDVSDYALLLLKVAYSSGNLG